MLGREFEGEVVCEVLVLREVRRKVERVQACRMMLEREERRIDGEQGAKDANSPCQSASSPRRCPQQEAMSLRVRLKGRERASRPRRPRRTSRLDKGEVSVMRGRPAVQDSHGSSGSSFSLPCAGRLGLAGARLPFRADDGDLIVLTNASKSLRGEDAGISSSALLCASSAAIMPLGLASRGVVASLS